MVRRLNCLASNGSQELQCATSPQEQLRVALRAAAADSVRPCLLFVPTFLASEPQLFGDVTAILPCYSRVT